MVKKFMNFILFYLIDFLSINIIKKKSTDLSLVIVKLDAIGDYILFRNFLEIIHKSNKFSNYKITLIGNVSWKEISIQFDNSFIDNFIWLDTTKFLNIYIYRFFFLKEIKKQEYTIVLNAEFSRSFWVSDWVVSALSSKNKIGHLGDLSNIKWWQKKISDLIYDSLFIGNSEVIFEFYRNRDFIEYLIEQNILINRTSLDTNVIKQYNGLPANDYVVLFLGSSKKSSKWSPRNYSKLAHYIINKYGLTILICGGKNDIDQAEEFKKVSNFEYIDLVGKTSILDLISIISTSKLLISNETSAPHFSIALNIKTIVLYCGNHYGRFVPYPDTCLETKYKCICHPFIRNYNYKEISNTYGYNSQLDINEILYEEVFCEIDNIL